MRIRSILALLALTSCAAVAGANELDANVSNKAVRLIGSTVIAPRMTVEAGWLRHVDRGMVLHLGLHLEDFATGGPNPAHAGLGGRLVHFRSTVQDDRGWGLALGGFVRTNIPNANRFQVGGSLYYAPQVLSFGGGDDFLEVNAYVGYEVLRQGAIYLGYRLVRADFQASPRANLDNGLHVGLKLRF